MKRLKTFSPVHDDNLSRYPVQDLLSDPHHVLLAIGAVCCWLLARTPPVHALEVRFAFVKAEARARRLVNYLIFPNLELIGYNRHCHAFSSVK